MAKDPREGIDGPGLARLCRCDERTIRNYAQRGWAVRLGHGRYALAESLGNIISGLREEAAARQITASGINPSEESALLRREQRQLAELKRQHFERKLISLPEVKAAWREAAQATQRLFLTLPSRARFDMPELTGAQQKRLTEICRDMLEETAAGAKGKASKPILPAVKVEAD